MRNFSSKKSGSMVVHFDGNVDIFLGEFPSIQIKFSPIEHENGAIKC